VACLGVFAAKKTVTCWEVIKANNAYALCQDGRGESLCMCVEEKSKHKSSRQNGGTNSDVQHQFESATWNGGG